MSIGHSGKTWSNLVLARQTELCSVNVIVDSKVTFEKNAPLHDFVNFLLM